MTASDAEAALMDAAEHDVLVCMEFPEQHRSKIRSTNPIERLNKKVKRRSGVVGMFRNQESVRNIAGTVLREQNDDWRSQHRSLKLETMAELTDVADTSITMLPPAETT